VRVCVRVCVCVCVRVCACGWFDTNINPCWKPDTRLWLSSGV